MCPNGLPKTLVFIITSFELVEGRSPVLIVGAIRGGCDIRNINYFAHQDKKIKCNRHVLNSYFFPWRWVILRKVNDTRSLATLVLLGTLCLYSSWDWAPIIRRSP